MIFDPRLMSVEQWTAFTGPLLTIYGYMPTESDEEHWMEWARRARSLPTISGYGVPMPEGFDDWRDWAVRLNEALLALGG